MEFRDGNNTYPQNYLTHRREQINKHSAKVNNAYINLLICSEGT